MTFLLELLAEPHDDFAEMVKAGGGTEIDSPESITPVVALLDSDVAGSKKEVAEAACVDELKPQYLLHDGETEVMPTGTDSRDEVVVSIKGFGKTGTW